MKRVFAWMGNVEKKWQTAMAKPWVNTTKWENTKANPDKKNRLTLADYDQKPGASQYPSGKGW